MMRVYVGGELDIARIEDMRAQLLAASAANAEVAVDLSGLEFIDSAGVQCLVDAVRHAAECGRRLQIEEPMRPQVRRVFTLLHQLSGGTLAAAPVAA